MKVNKMKNLNKTATDIFAAMLNGLNDVSDYRKIDNAGEGVMPVTIEVVGKREDGKGLVVSLAHYYEQNGDLMRDPEMVFLWFPEQKMVFPVTYRQDGLGLDQQAVTEFDESTGAYNGVYPRMQAQQTSFANLWMKNIKQQQRIAA
jgi:hypothetical protein